MRALVIDDSRPIRGIIAKIMRGLNFKTVEAGNGIEALRHLEESGSFDVVTINWEMPEMDGMEFINRIRRDSRYRKLPLLMISSISNEDSIKAARDAGVNDYLIKPCTERSITRKLQAIGVLEDPTAGQTASVSPVTEKPRGVGPSGEPIEARSALSGSKSATGNQRKSPNKSRTNSKSKKPDETLSKPIRVLLVDDSSVVRNIVRSTLEDVGGFEVVGGAADGIVGLEMIRQHLPDVVLLDVDMPRMNGLELLRELREDKVKVPIVMFSSRTEKGAKTTTDALLLGAKDFVFKPGGTRMVDLNAGRATVREQIAPRLKWLSARSALRVEKPVAVQARPTKKKDVDLVVIAASTGGPAALASVFHSPSFRQSLLKPILVVQHMPALFTNYLALRLAEETGLDIAEAIAGEALKPGMIRIAPGGQHLSLKRVRNEYQAVIDRSPAVNSCRPSADVLFLSAAQETQGNVLGVILSGMGYDGREGCRAIRQAGGWVIAQDEATSVVWGMPGSVVTEGLADHIIPIELVGKKIGSHLKVES